MIKERSAHEPQGFATPDLRVAMAIGDPLKRPSGQRAPSELPQGIEGTIAGQEKSSKNVHTPPDTKTTIIAQRERAATVCKTGR